MAEVIRIELSREDLEIVQDACIHKIVSLPDGTEQHRRLNGIIRSLFRAEYGCQEQADRKEEPPAAPAPAPHKHIQVPPVQQKHRSPLPPLNTYQPQDQRADDRGQTTAGSGGRRISDKQSGRFYAIQKKSNKRPSEVTEKLKSLGFSNYKAITADKYDELINWLQS